MIMRANAGPDTVGGGVGIAHRFIPESLLKLVDGNQSRGDRAVFAEQHIIGPAGRTGAHDLQTDIGLFKRGSDLLRRSIVPVARTQQQEIDRGIFRKSLLKRLWSQIRQLADFPSINSTGQHQQ